MGASDAVLGRPVDSPFRENSASHADYLRGYQLGTEVHAAVDGPAADKGNAGQAEPEPANPEGAAERS